MSDKYTVKNVLELLGFGDTKALTTNLLAHLRDAGLLERLLELRASAEGKAPSGLYRTNLWLFDPGSDASKHSEACFAATYAETQELANARGAAILYSLAIALGAMTEDAQHVERLEKARPHLGVALSILQDKLRSSRGAEELLGHPIPRTALLENTMQGLLELAPGIELAPEKETHELRLCFVGEIFNGARCAWFSRDFQKQSAENWHKEPYWQHLPATPVGPDVESLSFYSVHRTPEQVYVDRAGLESAEQRGADIGSARAMLMSVWQINRKGETWLHDPVPGREAHVRAGATVAEFREAMQVSGGVIL